jgi:hypothetical protein
VGEDDWLADRFEENREHPRPTAYRMLGSLSEEIPRSAGSGGLMRPGRFGE